MIKDLDRDIYTIKYNVLNLPDIIQFKNGNQIKNLYDAGGHKLGTEYFTWRPGANAPVVNAGDILNVSYSQSTTDQNSTAYIGNIEYNTLNGNTSLTTLSRIYNDEGCVENPANPQYYYFRHDHLGDNREVWLANTGETVQRTQYYPSGLPWAYNRTVDHPDLQHRKYNGKEFVEMHGYDTYDIVWRQYYPAIMRFQTPDPEIENDYDLSPYTMCDNNMLLKTDPNGRQAELAFEAYDMYKFGKYVKYALFGTAAVGAGAGTKVVYNHFVSGDRSKEVFKALTQGVDVKTNNTKEATTQKAKAATPEQRKEQERTEHRARKAAVEQAKGHQKVIENAPTPQPNGDSNRKRSPKGKVATVAVGTAVGIRVGMELTNPNPSKDAQESHEDKAKQKQDEQKKDKK